MKQQEGQHALPKGNSIAFFCSTRVTDR